MNCDRSSFASAWANIGRSADSTWTQEPLDLYTRANQQLWVRHCRQEKSDSLPPDFLGRDFHPNQNSGLPSRVASEVTSGSEAHIGSGGPPSVCRERSQASDGEADQAATEDGNTERATECWMLPEVEYWFRKLTSPRGGDGSPRPQLCPRDHELLEAAEVSSTQTLSPKLSQTELSVTPTQPFNRSAVADLWQDNESICSGNKGSGRAASLGEYDDLYHRHVIACGMQADPPPRCAVRSADERRLASRVRGVRALWAARAAHGKLRARTRRHAPPLRRPADPPESPWPALHAAGKWRRPAEHEPSKSKTSYSRGKVAASQNSKSGSKNIPVFQRPPESYAPKPQPAVQGPSSRSSCGSGVDFNNLIFLTNSQRNKLQSGGQQSGKYIDSLLRQSGHGRDSEASTSSTVFAHKMLNQLAASTSLFIPRPYEQPKGSDVFSRQSTLSHWIHDLYMARSKDFRNMFDLMGKLRVQSTAAKFFDYKPLAKPGDAPAQPKRAAANVCRILKTSEDDVASLSRAPSPAPPLKANLPQYRKLAPLAKNECQQRAKLPEGPTQKRLYSTVLCANNPLASGSLYRSPPNQCKSLDPKRHHPFPTPKPLNADCQFEELEKQAIEQYKTSDESINNKFTELERQALEQYDDGCVDCESVAAEKGCEGAKFCSSKGCVGDAETWEDFDGDLFECDRLKNRCIPPRVGGKKCARQVGKRRIDSCICIDGKRGVEARIGRGSKRPICLVAPKLRSGSVRSSGRGGYGADEKIPLQTSCLISSSRKVAKGDCGSKKRMCHQISNKMQVAAYGAGDLGIDP